MKEHFELPESECKRVTRTEMAALRMVLILASEINYAADDLCERLKIVPNGTDRMNALKEEVNSLFKDLLGTVTDKQRRTLRNSANDYEMRLVPKMTPDTTCLAMTKSDITELVNCAREKCKFCSFNEEEAKTKCALYILLENYIPLDDYGTDITCPYAYKDWIN